jgi:ParB family chromosome partitioning protein
MSKAADKALAESMGRRRPREVIQAEVAESVLAEMVQATTVDLPIGSLFRSRFQVREMGSEEDINKLAESMQASGLISPIVVRPIANPDSTQQINPIPDFLTDGKNLTVKCFEVITGHHRVQAALRLGWTMIPAVIKHMTDAQAAIALTSDNAIKKDLTDWDRYQSILMLKSTGACKTGREIAATLGVSPSQVTNLQAFGSLPEVARAIVQANPAVCAYKLAYKLQSSGLNEGEPALVAEALQHLADRLQKQEQVKDQLQKDELTAQEQVIPWIMSKVAARNATRSYRREIRIQRPVGKDIRVVVMEGGATIKADGLNTERLAKLIEDNLAMLIEDVAAM